jgi:dTDP-4-amino-4,6-dideoxygalactose transaminase
LAALHLAAGTMSRRQHYKNTRQRFYNTTHISRTTINLPCISSLGDDTSSFKVASQVKKRTP